jgi:hypothetical protein
MANNQQSASLGNIINMKLLITQIIMHLLLLKPTSGLR